MATKRLFNSSRFTLLPCLVISILLVVFEIVLPSPGLAASPDDELPAQARVILGKAGAMIKNKQYTEAIVLVEKFQKSGKDQEKAERQGCFHPEVYTMLGTCYLLAGKLPQAVQAFEGALRRDPANIPARLNLAKAGYDQGNYRQAAAQFEKAYDVAVEKNPEHLYFAAVACLLAKDATKSVALFEQLYARHQGKFSPEWRENMIHALLEAGQTKKALSHILALIEICNGKKQQQWQEILLQEYLQLDMAEDALQLATRLTESSPWEAKWWRALVHIRLSRSQHQPALTSLLILSYIAPLPEQEQRLLADLFLQAGVPKKAAPLYSQLLEEKNSPQLLGNAIVALQQLGQSEQALILLDRFGAKPLSPDLIMKKADLLYQLRQYSKAAELYLFTARSSGKEKKRALQMAEYAKAQASFHQS